MDQIKIGAVKEEKTEICSHCEAQLCNCCCDVGRTTLLTKAQREQDIWRGSPRSQR
jgi:hypothetical protein